MATAVTDMQYDAVCAAVAAPYGPLVRVGNVMDMTPNSDRRVEVTSALGLTMFLTYDQINDATTITRLLATEHSQRGYNHVTWDIFRAIKAIFYNIDSWAGPPYSDVEHQNVIDALRTIRALVAQVPNISVDPTDAPVAAFTWVDAGGQAVDVTNTTTPLPATGDILFYVWEWGDVGDYSVGANPANHVFASGAGNYTVTLTVVGPGGVSSFSDVVTVA